MNQWAPLISSGYGSTFVDSACSLLDEMVEGQRMNAKTLMSFYLGLMEIVFTTIPNSMTSIFNTSEKLEIYRNGMRDIPSMKKLIHLIGESSDGIVSTEEAEDQRTRVDRIMRYINEHLSQDLKREEIAESMNLSPDYMTKIFKAETGMTVKEYIIQQKMQMAQSLLKMTRLPISLVASKVGYSNFSHFSYTYKKRFGIPPQEERREK